jgi:acyl-CoA reductase-like NAD-dependent aldehyde dehydrogenase
VIGLIVPWNYPLNPVVTDAVPALMAGNAAILKPDAFSFTALWALSLLRGGAASRCIHCGDGRRPGPALGERVDYVMFTGSTRPGAWGGDRQRSG